MTNENQTIGYALWAVLSRPAAPSAPAPEVASLGASIARLEDTGVSLRGLYDVSGLRADADLMIWLTGSDAQPCRRACEPCGAPRR